MWGSLAPHRSFAMAEISTTADYPATPERIDQCQAIPDPIVSVRSPDSSNSSDTDFTLNLRNAPSDSPAPNCTICLGRCNNKCFADPCLHQFCFKCLLECSEVKAECPLCREPFKSIIHNVKSIYQFEEYLVGQPQPNQPNILTELRRARAETQSTSRTSGIDEINDLTVDGSSLTTQPQILEQSRVIQIGRNNFTLNSSSSDECEFVGEQKPPHLRTPEIVTINSESDSDVAFASENKTNQRKRAGCSSKNKRNRKNRNAKRRVPLRRNEQKEIEYHCF